MASRPLNFRQRDITAAVKAVERAGKNVAAVEVDGEGTIHIYVGGGNKAVPTKSRIALEKMIDDEEASLRSKLHR
jgi:hypothetical protein